MINHPLTPGLLASMAMRWNHAMFMPINMEEGMIGIGPWDRRIPRGLRHAREAYANAVAGTLSDVQLLEEVEGRGFYSPDLEEHYAGLLEGFPGMLDLARSLTTSWPQD